MTKFRLTIGENNTAWGKQRVLVEKEAVSAFEFAKDVVFKFAPGDQLTIVKNAWIDAGSGTIPIAVASLRLFV